MVVAEIIDKWQGKVFQWGKSDCSSFANDAIEAMTGKPAIKEGELRFSSRQNLQKSIDGAALFELFRRLLAKSGMKQSDFPKREAIGIVKLDRETPSLSVWDGAKLWMISKTGLREIDPSLVAEWWEPAI